MSYLINLNAEEEVQLSNIQQFLKGSKTSAIRWALTQVSEKILPSLLLSNNANMQPAPSAPSVPAAPPAARHVPTVEEVLAMRKPDASEACWEFWGDWTEEQRRALIGPLEITNRSVLDKQFGLSPDDEPYGDD